MAVNPGNNFSQLDLAALAALANGVSSPATFNLTEFWNVAPMFLNQTVSPATNYGYRQLGSFAIVNRGTGFAIGDKIVLVQNAAANPGTPIVEFEVAAVDAAGGLVGLLTLSVTPYGPGTSGNGWETANDPGSPQAPQNLSSSGTGAAISFTCNRVGPTAAYAFPDYSLDTGTATGAFIVSGGTGYSVSDVLLFGQPAPMLAATVTSVGTGGAVTGVAFSGTGAMSGVPANAAAFPVTGGTGSGCLIGLLYVQPPRPTWLTELNRLRTNLANVVPGTPPGISGGPLYCSGANIGSQLGWPKSGYTSDIVYDPASSYQYFYFDWDTSTQGALPTLTMTAMWNRYTGFSDAPGMEVGLGPLASEQIPFPTQGGSPLMGGPSQVMYTGAAYKFSLRCPPGTTWSGVFTLQVFSGVARFGDDPVALANYPGIYGSTPGFAVAGGGATYTADGGTTQPTGGGYMATINLSGLGSGDYVISFTGGYFKVVPTAWAPDGTPIGWACPCLLIGEMADIGGVETYGWCCGGYATQASISGGEFSPPLVFSAQPADGIDRLRNVYRIALPPLNFDIGYGGTIYEQNEATPPVPPVCVYGPAISTDLTFSKPVYGFWVGTTEPVASLNLVSETQMPWNLTRTRMGGSIETPNNIQVNPMLLGDQGNFVSPNNTPVQSNSYAQTTPVEKQSEPPAWLAGVEFTVGFTIQDSNGNWQQCSTAGVSGPAAPAWATIIGEITNDGGSPTGNPALPTIVGGADWQLIYKPKFSVTPATHRPVDIPRYPFYWNSETITKLKPPTSSSGLTVWGAYDQWQPTNMNGPGSYDAGWQCMFPSTRTGFTTTPADTRGQAFGWWIYSVSVNRTSQFKAMGRQPVASSIVGAGDTGAPGAGDEGASGTGAGGVGSGPEAGGLVDETAIAVQIGCIRNGTFVAFSNPVNDTANFYTGQTYQVLWPVFTSDALVYQCSERIDVQAVAIASGAAGVSVGAAIAEPTLIARYVLDATAWLGLIH